MVAKMIISHFILNYEFKLADEKVPARFNWGVASIPHPRLAILVRHREQESRAMK
jgi:hypothetical protein